MIVTLQDVKSFLKLEEEDTEEDTFLNSLILVSEEYLKNTTGQDFDNTNPLARLYCQVIISDWYENRNFIREGKMSDKVRFTIQSILTQLQYCYLTEV